MSQYHNPNQFGGNTPSGIPTSGDMTVRQLTQRVVDTIDQLGGSVGAVTPESTIMLMMSYVGSLASYCSANPGVSGRSDFDQAQVQQLIGGLMFGVCALGAAFGVDPGTAAVTAAVEQRARSSTELTARERGGVLRPQQQQQPQYPPMQQQQPVPQMQQQPPQSQWRPSQAPPQQQQQQPTSPPAEYPGPTDIGIVSPRSIDDLDKLVEELAQQRATLSPGQFARFGLTFLALDNDGRAIDLVQDGRHELVTLDRFDEFLRLFRQHQGGQKGGAPAGVRGMMNPPAQVPTQSGATARPALETATDSGHVVARDPTSGSTTVRYNVAQPIEGGLASPSHDSGGLFSPGPTANQIDVTYGGSAPAAPAALTLGAAPAPVPAPPPPPSAQQQSQQQQQQYGAADGPTRDQISNSEALFQPRFLQLQKIVAEADARRAAAGDNNQFEHKLLPYKDEIAALRLTFAIPYRDRAYSLVSDNQGANIHVTYTNASEFVELAREQMAVFAGRVMRQPSVKTLAARQPVGGDPAREAGGYSPGHGMGDLFAPAQSKTAVMVDYDRNLLPRVMLADRPQNFESASDYVDYIAAQPEQFPHLYNRALREPGRVLPLFHLTYCIPDPNAPRPEHTRRAPRTGILDLFPNGRNIEVQPQDIGNYEQLVREFTRPDIPQIISGPAGNRR